MVDNHRVLSAVSSTSPASRFFPWSKSWAARFKASGYVASGSEVVRMRSSLITEASSIRAAGRSLSFVASVAS